ncbi:hypothetical protein [Arthrobacter sp. efr-133-TYG-104]|uniref:hypothetical protein n=1 Tax=Arthrobacter sp. efr-133-TYG-104 TaxID=3040324 RepID=UPI00254B3A01|nr:hypothetical protein [Arthrobacter sp. efr-133-TYG-104]
MKHGIKVLFFCRLHEVEHPRWTPDIEHANLVRLAAKITPLNGCWIASGPVLGKKGGYVAFIPEGANTAQWTLHRVPWNLLAGGPKPGYELDHMAKDCNPSCCNPAHLEPGRRGENEKLKRRRRGPSMNWAAAEAPAVMVFARKYGLLLAVKTMPA